MSRSNHGSPDNSQNISINQPDNMENLGGNVSPDNNETIGQERRKGHPNKPLRRVPSTPYLEDKLKRRLKFFFMGPHEKIVARKKCPWKLILQILKVVIVTIQVGFSCTSTLIS